MRRVLMVSYYFPPLGGIGSLRALKFATYLPEFGWQPTVLAPRRGAYHRDASLRFPEEQVVRTAALELSRVGKRAVGTGGDDTQPAAVGPLLGRARDLVRRFVYRPDAQVGWYPFAVAAGRSALRERRFDAVLSSSFPITSHVVARRLHRDTGLPWVAEFRDPWTDVLNPRDPRRPRDERLERALVAEAAAVVVPSPAWAELFRRKGARVVEVIANGYDPADLPPSRPPRGFVLTHVGSLYPDRQDLSTVWPALAALRAARVVVDLRLRFVGELSSAVRRQIEAHGLADSLEVTGFLPYRDALAAMAASSALLVAGARDPLPALEGWIPAKVFEYLGTGLPVIYVGDGASDAARLLAGHARCHLVPPDDVEAARRALLAASREAPQPRALAAFTRRTLAGRLAGVLAGVAA
jgi:glycosyltransferase involved in cell wall biosynthesis